MGQYYKIVNTEKKQYIDPRNLRAGLKMWEIVHNLGGLLIYLTGRSSGAGGGDPRGETQHFGRWANNRVIVVGDYHEEGPNAGLYNRVEEDPEYTEISSDSLIEEFNDFYGNEAGPLG